MDLTPTKEDILMDYEKDLANAMEQFMKDLRIYQTQGRDFNLFFSDLRLTACDGGKNLAAVAKVFVNGSCRLYLAQHGMMLANPWNGEVESVPHPIKDGTQYLIRVHFR